MIEEDFSFFDCIKLKANSHIDKFVLVCIPEDTVDCFHWNASKMFVFDSYDHFCKELSTLSNSIEYEQYYNFHYFDNSKNNGDEICLIYGKVITPQVFVELMTVKNNKINQK